MVLDGSESVADLLEVHVAAGLGSVETKPGTIDVLARDHAAGNSSLPFLPAVVRTHPMTLFAQPMLRCALKKVRMPQ